jgi:hypothetical protein
MLHNRWNLRASFNPPSLSRDHLLDLSLGKSLELGTSTDKVTVEVDVGDGTLSVELLEVGLDGGWDVSLDLFLVKLQSSPPFSTSSSLSVSRVLYSYGDTMVN